MASVAVDLCYSGANYGVTDCGNPSSGAGLDRDSGTSRDDERTRSEEAVKIGSLCIQGSEDNEDEPKDDDDDDDDNDSDGNDEGPVPVAHTSSSGHRPAPSKGKGLTSSFMSVMSKIAGSR